MNKKDVYKRLRCAARTAVCAITSMPALRERSWRASTALRTFLFAPLLALTFLCPAPDAAAQATVTIAPKEATAVAEGTTAVFTVTRTGATTSSLTVNLRVEDAPNSDFVPAASEGDKTVAITPGSASADFTVSVQGNSKDEPDGPVKVTVLPGASYTPGSPSAATRTVNDTAGTTVSVTGTTTAIDEGGTKTFTVSIIRGLYNGESVSIPLKFTGTASRGASGDYTLACGSATGVTCSNLNSGTMTVLFRGPATGQSADSRSGLRTVHHQRPAQVPGVLAVQGDGG